jgi:hypothetical protein
VWPSCLRRSFAGLLIAEITVWNPADVMDFRLLCLLCVV